MSKKEFTRGEMKDKIEKLQLKNVRLQQEIIHNDNAISEAHKVNDELQKSLEKAVELIERFKKEVDQNHVPNNIRIEVDRFLTSHEKI